MLIIINAFKSIIRSAGRNILIGIIILTIAVSSCISLAIKSAADSAERDGLNDIEITAIISAPRIIQSRNMQGGSATSVFDEGLPELTLDELLYYSDSDYVKDFYYTGNSSMNTTGDLEAVSDSNSDSNNNSSNNSSGFSPQPGMGVQIMGGMALGDFNITAYSSENAMTAFLSGSSKISEGSLFDFESTEYECIINEDLATYNDLVIGDTISLCNPNQESETYEFKITGIYKNEPDDSVVTMMRLDPANNIYVSYNTLASISAHSQTVASTVKDRNNNDISTAFANRTNGTFVFSGKNEFEYFDSEARIKGLDSEYSITSMDVEQFEQKIAPIKNLSSFASAMLLIILGVGSLILVVINIFNIRERKYEIGVLTAIGIKKIKVSLQFVFELLTVCLIAIIIGSVIGAVVSVPVSNQLLSSQIETQEQKSSSINQNMGRPDNAQGNRPSGTRIQSAIPINGGRFNMNVEYIKSINAAINFKIILQMIGIGVILTIISSLVAIVFVMRYEPLKILANRA